MAGKGIGRFLFMILLGTENLQDRIHSLAERLIKMSGAAGKLPQKISQLDRIAQRIDLIFSLPDTWILIFKILLPAGAVRLLVKSIGIGVNKNAGKLSLYQSLNDICQFLITGGKIKIGAHLGR